MRLRGGRDCRKGRYRLTFIKRADDGLDLTNDPRDQARSSPLAGIIRRSGNGADGDEKSKANGGEFTHEVVLPSKLLA